MSGMFRISDNLAKMSALKNRKVEPSLFKGGGSVFWIYEGRLGVLFRTGIGQNLHELFSFPRLPFFQIICYDKSNLVETLEKKRYYAAGCIFYAEMPIVDV